jgi:hypothetical protein
MVLLSRHTSFNVSLIPIHEYAGMHFKNYELGSIKWGTYIRIILQDLVKFDFNCTALVHSVVGIATGYGLDGLGFEVRMPVRSSIFIVLYFSCRLWGPPGLLSNG